MAEHRFVANCDSELSCLFSKHQRLDDACFRVGFWNHHALRATASIVRSLRNQSLELRKLTADLAEILQLTFLDRDTLPANRRRVSRGCAARARLILPVANDRQNSEREHRSHGRNGQHRLLILTEKRKRAHRNPSITGLSGLDETQRNGGILDKVLTRVLLILRGRPVAFRFGIVGRFALNSMAVRSVALSRLSFVKRIAGRT